MHILAASSPLAWQQTCMPTALAGNTQLVAGLTSACPVWPEWKPGLHQSGCSCAPGHESGHRQTQALPRDGTVLVLMACA